jgi:hypothetical protein
MGIYVYKVTKNIKVLADGTRANIAVFAYKPYSGWRDEDLKANARMSKDSGCPQAERFARQKSKSWMGRAVLGELGEVAVTLDRGTFEDHWFDHQVTKQDGAAQVAA